MKPEKQLLIDHLLDGAQSPSEREATLLAGGRLLRRKRWTRATSRTFAIAAALALAAIALRKGLPPERKVLSESHPLAPPVPSLTDEQLLELFPDTPVGLATIGDKKVLLFLHPADRERFVGKF
jgi:hypothetical protein